jgi:ferredoxin
MDEEIKVHLDRDECISCAVCWASCEEVFEENPEDGLTQIVELYRDDDDLSEGTIPATLEDCVREAAEDCPVDVIRVSPLG